MPKLNVYTVHDIKAEAYITPFFLPTDAVAERTFTDCANDRNHQFGKNPADYTLFKVGEFDTQTGVFSIYETPTPIGKALDFQRPSRFEEMFPHEPQPE